MLKNGATVTSSLLILFCIAAGVFVASCSTFVHKPVAMMPLAIPGAEYVGMETCVACHKAEHQYFRLSEHASVTVKQTGDQPGKVEGCETCHGPGSLHVGAGGDRDKILRGSPETCYSCHTDIRGKFHLQYHHPVPEGRMVCSSCHALHGKDVRATGGEGLLGRRLHGKNEKCFECHKEQRGPFVFEHDAMREGCQTCHNPHGSIYDKLLVAGQSTLCLRCHWEVSFNKTAGAGLGGIKHGDTSIGKGEECVDHHRAPHGSNIWRTFNR